MRGERGLLFVCFPLSLSAVAHFAVRRIGDVVERFLLADSNGIAYDERAFHRGNEIPRWRKMRILSKQVDRDNKWPSYTVCFVLPSWTTMSNIKETDKNIRCIDYKILVTLYVISGVPMLRYYRAVTNDRPPWRWIPSSYIKFTICLFRSRPPSDAFLYSCRIQPCISSIFEFSCGRK